MTKLYFPVYEKGKRTCIEVDPYESRYLVSENGYDALFYRGMILHPLEGMFSAPEGVNAYWCNDYTTANRYKVTPADVGLTNSTQCRDDYIYALMCHDAEFPFTGFTCRNVVCGGSYFGRVAFFDDDECIVGDNFYSYGLCGGVIYKFFWGLVDDDGNTIELEDIDAQHPDAYEVYRDCNLRKGVC